MARGRGARTILLLILCALLPALLITAVAPGLGAAPSASIPSRAAPSVAGFEEEAPKPSSPSTDDSTPAVGSGGTSTSSSVRAVATEKRPGAEAIEKRSPEAEAEARRRGIMRMLVGLAATVILAILAAHPRVRRIEARFGLTIAVASGLPFLLLGAVFQHPSVDVLDQRVLGELAPFLEFGLGWVGFALGLEFDVHKLEELPAGTGGAIAFEALVPFALASVLATAAIVMMRVAGHEGGWNDPISLRNGLVVGSCAALSAATAPLALARGAGKSVAKILNRMAQLDDIAGLVVLLVLSAFFRPLKSIDWQIPAIGWLFVAIGFGCVLGMLTFALVRGARNDKEELAFTLGAVCFSAGVSGRLGFSPLVVCGVAGMLVANLPKRKGSQLVNTLRTVERPAYLLFMLMAGATLPFGAWQGWALLPVYIFARVTGKLVGARLAGRFGPKELANAPGMGLALMPQSPMSVALMLAMTTLYLANKDNALGWIFLAVVVGGYVNDVGTQIVAQYVNRVPSTSIDDAAKSIHPGPNRDETSVEIAFDEPGAPVQPGAFPIPRPAAVPKISLPEGETSPNGSTERE